MQIIDLLITVTGLVEENYFSLFRGVEWKHNKDSRHLLLLGDSRNGLKQYLIVN